MLREGHVSFVGDTSHLPLSFPLCVSPSAVSELRLWIRLHRQVRVRLAPVAFSCALSG